MAWGGLRELNDQCPSRNDQLENIFRLVVGACSGGSFDPRLQDDHHQEAAGDGGEDEAAAEEDVDQESEADGAFAERSAEGDEGGEGGAEIDERGHGEDFVAEGFDFAHRLDDANEADGGETDAEHAGGDGNNVQQVGMELVVAVVILHRNATGLAADRGRAIVEHWGESGKRLKPPASQHYATASASTFGKGLTSMTA